MRSNRPSCRLGAVLVLAAALSAQAPGRHVGLVMQDKDLVALQWRRSATGVLECAPTEDKPPTWAPLFPEGVLGGVQVSGGFVPMGLLLHGDDLLSLTSGEVHLSRLGVATATAELRQYLVSPLMDLAELAVLDRMVAIDVLVARGAKNAVAELQQIARDAAMPAALRERAATAVTRLQGGTLAARPRLDAKTLRLPADADVFLVVDQAAMPSMGFVVELGRFTGLLASAMVLDTVKQATPADFLIGQTESEMLTELPFELARALGNPRLDQTLLTVRMPRKQDEAPQVTLHVAGRFEPKTVEAMLAKLGDASAGLDLQVSATDLSAASKQVALAPDEARAKALLDLDGFAMRLHVPAGSPLLAQMRPFGLPPTESLDIRIGFGTHVRSRFVLTLPAGQDVDRWRESAQRVVEREILDKAAEAGELLGLPADALVVKFTPAPGSLVVTSECAIDQLPKMEQLKQFCLRRIQSVPR